jgi:hypothetical protein
MALRFVSGSSEYLSNATLCSITDYPFTLSCWFREEGGGTRGLVYLVDTASGNYHQGLDLRTSGGNTVNAASKKAGPAEVKAVTTTNWSTNTWHHACGVFAANNDRRAFLDGGGKGTNTGNVSFEAGLDSTYIGARRSNGTTSFYMQGRICETAIWNIALTDTEVAALGAGACPLLIRPDALVAYWPIGGVYSGDSDNVDILGGYNVTDNGTPDPADHRPGIFYPPTEIWTPEVSAAAYEDAISQGTGVGGTTATDITAEPQASQGTGVGGTTSTDITAEPQASQGTGVGGTTSTDITAEPQASQGTGVGGTSEAEVSKEVQASQGTGVGGTTATDITAEPQASQGTGVGGTTSTDITAEPQASQGTGVGGTSEAEVSKEVQASQGTGVGGTTSTDITAEPQASQGTGVSGVASTDITAEPQASQGTGIGGTAVSELAGATYEDDISQGTGVGGTTSTDITAEPQASQGTGVGGTTSTDITAEAKASQETALNGIIVVEALMEVLSSQGFGIGATITAQVITAGGFPYGKNTLSGGMQELTGGLL